MTGFRTDRGGLIDRTKPLSFTFDGKPYTGFEGDTLASALMANGVRVIGRSFKYHRPRGLWGAWVDEPNAIMTVSWNGKTLPNCLATTTTLEAGMQARSVNAWPSAAFDVKGGLDFFHRWLGAGFYYKTFMWPNWHLFEPAIRKMAGLGATTEATDDSYVSDQLHDRCETLVIGGGAAGLVAAHSAAEAGQNVVLIDDHGETGGTAYQLEHIEGEAPAAWIAAQTSAIKAAGGRILTATTAMGVFDHGMVALVQNGRFGTAPRLIRMRTGRVIMATGALDRPVTFAGNDRPGIISLLGAAEYLARYGVLPGKSLAILCNNSAGTEAVSSLEAAGVDVTPIDGSQIEAGGPVRALSIAASGFKIKPDALLVSGGLTPVVHLWRHVGGKLDWCEARQAFLPGKAPDGFSAIGAANGTFDPEACISEARAAGQGHPQARPASTYHLTPLWPKPGSKGRQWIDFQHDVTLKDVELAARENYVSVEHLKRYTTLGMASDQGKTSNMTGLAAMASTQGRPIPEVGTTTFRPPFVPVPIETFHGAARKTLNHPLKRLVLEPEHRAADAALGEYGGWLRPGWYGSGDPAGHIAYEALTVRKTAGILDGSPLGKIEVMGPDAEKFVNFIYYNTINTLKPGAIRYGFMLTEGGVVFDDGVIARHGPDHFTISCSSSHVDSVRAHLETWRQDGNDPDRIFIHDVTAHWATVTVAGPKAREIVQTLGLAIDLGTQAFPHMTHQVAVFEGAPLRIARVSFTGDTSYELSIRTSQAALLYRAIMAAGTALGAVPIGIEALSILRAEKGFIMVGKDTDGETMPHDLGFGVPRQKKTTAFVGDRSLHTDKASNPTRKVLVGLKTPKGAPAIATGAHIFSDSAPRRSIGYVTSSYDSPFLGMPIALALVEHGTERVGQEVILWHQGVEHPATLCPPCFLDPDGGRLNAG